MKYLILFLLFVFINVIEVYSVKKNKNVNYINKGVMHASTFVDKEHPNFKESYILVINITNYNQKRKDLEFEINYWINESEFDEKYNYIYRFNNFICLLTFKQPEFIELFNQNQIVQLDSNGKTSILEILNHSKRIIRKEDGSFFRYSVLVEPRYKFNYLKERFKFYRVLNRK